MLKSLFGRRPTTRGDVIIAVVGVVVAAFHATDVIHQFKSEQDTEEQEIEK